MLMRFDPFRDFDRLAQQRWGVPSNQAGMPMDAYRDGDRDCHSDSADLRNRRDVDQN